MTFQCEFCHREFQRERTIVAHMCEPKRRRLGRGERGPELGFQAYLRFYEITQGSTRVKTWEDFCGSPYYRAFVKWGRYCVDTRAVNPTQFLEWLLRNNRKIDRWATDRQYEEFLLDYVRRESVTDALARAVEWSITWGEEQRAPSHDCLRYGNTNAICHTVVSGKITAWIIYNCESGQDLLSRLRPDQVTMIWPWIDADIWQQRFRDHPEDQDYAKQILKQAGW